MVYTKKIKNVGKSPIKIGRFKVLPGDYFPNVELTTEESESVGAFIQGKLFKVEEDITPKAEVPVKPVVTPKPVTFSTKKVEDEPLPSKDTKIEAPEKKDATAREVSKLPEEVETPTAKRATYKRSKRNSKTSTEHSED